MKKKSAIKVLLASPRGFCAGVERAITMVEEALLIYGAPIYVRGHIVHNHYVVDHLRNKGVCFVSHIAHIPRGSVVLLSAHGSEISVLEQCSKRDIVAIDAICPLVLKVHKQVHSFLKKNNRVAFIGHHHHPETRGILGQNINRRENIFVLETVEDVCKIPYLSKNDNIGYVTQTTISPESVIPIVHALEQRFGKQHVIRGQKPNDICYATHNRQESIKAIAKEASLILIAGSSHSSNTQRLKEVAEKEGVEAHLVDVPHALPWENMTAGMCIGLTAGASAPEILVSGILENLQQRYSIEQKTLSHKKERVHFSSPLTAQAHALEKS